MKCTEDIFILSMKGYKLMDLTQKPLVTDFGLSKVLPGLRQTSSLPDGPDTGKTQLTGSGESKTGYIYKIISSPIDEKKAFQDFECDPKLKDLFFSIC